MYRLIVDTLASNVPFSFRGGGGGGGVGGGGGGRYFWEVVVEVCRLDCKTVGFLLKISKAIGKAWRKSLTRGKRASLNARRACEARGKKPTVRFPYNGFVQTRGVKNVYELSKICSPLHPLCEFDTPGD